jgi:hypothetical protein
MDTSSSKAHRRIVSYNLGEVSYKQRYFSVGSVCLVLSIVVLLYGAKTAAGAYIWLFLTGIGLIILGVERVISGLYAKDIKTSSRLINIGVGAGLIIYIGSGFFYPQFATKWLIIFLGFGLLANGVIRIVEA